MVGWEVERERAQVLIRGRNRTARDGLGPRCLDAGAVTRHRDPASGQALVASRPRVDEAVPGLALCDEGHRRDRRDRRDGPRRDTWFAVDPERDVTDVTDGSRRWRAVTRRWRPDTGEACADTPTGAARLGVAILSRSPHLPSLLSCRPGNPTQGAMSASAPPPPSSLPNCVSDSSVCLRFDCVCDSIVCVCVCV